MSTHNTPDRAEAYHRVTDVIRCKWTLAVLHELRDAPRRPSDILRTLPGLTQKVLNERLRKLERYGLLEREAFAEVPPRVEYSLNERGKSLARLVDDVNAFVDGWADRESSSAR